MSSVETVTILISLSDVAVAVPPSAPSSVPPPAITSRFMPALPWWTVLTWDRRLSTRLNPLPHLSHKKGFSPKKRGVNSTELSWIREINWLFQDRVFFFLSFHLYWNINYSWHSSIPTCVYYDVFGEVPHVNKCLIAHLTFVWTNIVVMANVISQLTGLHKPVKTKMNK